MPGGRMRVLKPDAAILRRREQEDRLNTAKNFLQEQHKTQSAAQWQDRVNSLGARLDQVRSDEEKQAAEQADLERRRVLLGAKLRREEEDQKRALLESQEAVSSRRSQLLDTAHQKAAAREAERARLAAEMQKLQFQESCDPLRAKQSQQRLLAVLEEQKQQVAEKQQQYSAEAAKLQALDAAALAEDARQALQYKLNMDQTRKKYLELKSQLDDQVRDQKDRLAQETAASQAESQELLQQFKLAEAAAKEAGKTEANRKRELQNQLQSLNRAKQAEKADRKAAERSAEIARLEAALRDENMAEAKDRAAKLAKAEATRQYRSHLEASLLKEHNSSTERDLLIEQANKAQQAKEDARQAAAEAARAKLAHEVLESRMHQIQQQALSKEHIDGERQHELERLQKLSAEAALREAQETENLRKEEIRYRMELQAQIAAKQHKAAAEKAAAKQAAEQAAAAEVKFEEKLSAVLTDTKPRTDFRRKKVDWYT